MVSWSYLEEANQIPVEELASYGEGEEVVEQWARLTATHGDVTHAVEVA